MTEPAPAPAKRVKRRAAKPEPAAKSVRRDSSVAGVYTAHGLGEVHQMVAALALQGFRIVTVIDTHNGNYHVVAQRDDVHEVILAAVQELSQTKE